MKKQIIINTSILAFSFIIWCFSDYLYIKNNKFYGNYKIIIAIIFVLITLFAFYYNFRTLKMYNILERIILSLLITCLLILSFVLLVLNFGLMFHFNIGGEL